MGPKSRKKEEPKKQISIKGFFSPKKREAEEKEESSKRKKLEASPNKAPEDEAARQTNNNELEDEASSNNNNNNNNNIKVEKPEKSKKSSEIEEIVSSKIVVEEKDTEEDFDSDDDQHFDDANDLIGSDHEDDPSPAGSATAAKETFILKPQSPVSKDKSLNFKCKVCDQWFPNRYFQRKHMLMEHEDQCYECRICSFHSVDPEKLKNHIIKQHVAKKERSESTLSLDAVQVDLDELMTRHTPRKVIMEDGVALGRDSTNKMRFICAICERIYTSKYSLERHVRCHTGEKPFTCDVCDFSTSYREHMQRHMTSVHLIVHSDEPKQKYVPKNRRKTEDKNPSTEDEDPLNVDVSSNTGIEADSSFNSNDGSYASSETSSVAKKRRNILRRRFECAACGLKATHKTDLISHIKEKHPKAHIESLKNGDGSKVHLIVTVSKKANTSKRLTITCPDCSKVFHDTWKYKIHMRSHTGVKPFGCNICPFFANRKMTVRDHIHRKHKDVTNPKILLRTVQIDGTVDHVELDIPQKEFRCDVCDTVFTDNYHMKQHKKKAHEDALPFSCSECGHKEAARATLLMHCMQKHQDKDLNDLVLKNHKPLTGCVKKLPKCDVCDKIFAYQSQLYIHQKQHTGERSFFCDLCDFSTNHKQTLTRHIQQHLGEVDPPKRKSNKKKPRVNPNPDEPINFVDVGVKGEK